MASAAPTDDQIHSEKLDALRERQKRATERGREIIERADAEDRALKPEELEQYEALNEEANSLFRRIAVETKQTKLERDLARPGTKPPKPDLGLENVPMHERRNYSLTRAAAAFFSRDWRRAGFEKEMDEELQRQSNRTAKGFLVPWWALIPTDEQLRAIPSEKRTTISVSLGSSPPAATLVPTEHLGDSFIEILRNASATGQLGATMLTGLVGNVEIPREATAASATWVSAEDTAATESNATFDELNLTPHDVALFTNISRRTIQQSVPGIEGLVRLDQQRALGLAIDAAAVNGTGTGGQPTGILNAGTGLGTVSTSGTMTWAKAIEFETDVAASNALMGSLGYLMRAELFGTLKAAPKVSGDPSAGFIVEPNGTMNGYRVARSQQCPQNLGTMNDLQAAIFGDWSSLIIAEWGGGIDILVDPYSLGTKGGVRLVAFATVDVGIRHLESFSISTDINE